MAEVKLLPPVPFRMSKMVRSTMNRTSSSELRRQAQVGASWKGLSGLLGKLASLSHQFRESLGRPG